MLANVTAAVTLERRGHSGGHAASHGLAILFDVQELAPKQVEGEAFACVSRYVVSALC
jgi:hypothetical protein